MPALVVIVALIVLWLAVRCDQRHADRPYPKEKYEKKSDDSPD